MVLRVPGRLMQMVCSSEALCQALLPSRPELLTKLKAIWGSFSPKMPKVEAAAQAGDFGRLVWVV